MAITNTLDCHGWILSTSSATYTASARRLNQQAFRLASEAGAGMSAYDAHMRGIVQQSTSNPAPPQSLPSQMADRPAAPLAKVVPSPTGKVAIYEVDAKSRAGPVGTNQAAEYVDLNASPQYFMERQQREYEISETRWVRVRKNQNQ